MRLEDERTAPLALFEKSGEFCCLEGQTINFLLRRQFELTVVVLQTANDGLYFAVRLFQTRRLVGELLEVFRQFCVFSLELLHSGSECFYLTTQRFALL